MILLIRFVDKLGTNFLLKDRQVKRRGIKPRLIFNAYPYLKIPMGLPVRTKEFSYFVKKIYFLMSLMKLPIESFKLTTT